MMTTLATSLRRWGGYAPAPGGIDLLLTDACNLRCTYCPIWGENATYPAAGAARFMETGAALRLHDMADNLAGILSIELLAAAQGLEFHRPLQSSAAVEQAHGLVRGVAAAWGTDRVMAPDIAAVKALVERGRFAGLVDFS